MVKEETHSFAKQYLSKRGIEIFQGEKRVLVYNGSPNYYIRRPDSKIHVEELVDSDAKIEKIEDYGRLKKLGYCIVRKSVESDSKVVLEKYYEGKKCIPRMQNNYVEYDAGKKRLRIVGPTAGYFGIGDWFYMGKDAGAKTTVYDIDTIMEYPFEVLEQAKEIWFPEEKHRISVEIKEMNLLITSDYQIVCIPNGPDEPTIACVGQKRAGKSYLMHRITDLAFHKLNKLCGVINDSLRECGTWCLPNSSKDDVKILKKLNEYPLPLPCVYLTPHTEDVEDGEEELIHPEEVGFAVSLPYKTIVEKFYEFVDLGKSSSFFSNLKEKLLVCQDMDEIREVLGENIDSKGTIDKIDRFLSDLYRQKVLDINTGVPSIWTVRDKHNDMEFNPLTACVMAGLLPVFETANLLTKPYYPAYFRYYAGDIFARQTKDSYFRDNKVKIWLFIDEVLDVSSTEEETVASETLKKIVTQGGPKRIGTILATQNYSKIERRVRTNIKYLFTFANPGEANIIGSDYSLDKEVVDRIKTLPKYHCVAITSDEFIVYDIKTGRKYKSKGPFEGMALPPLSQHKAPSAQGG